jgi:hypothetical protein
MASFGDSVSIICYVDPLHNYLLQHQFLCLLLEIGGLLFQSKIQLDGRVFFVRFASLLAKRSGVFWSNNMFFLIKKALKVTFQGF